MSLIPIVLVHTIMALLLIGCIYTIKIPNWLNHEHIIIDETDCLSYHYFNLIVVNIILLMSILCIIIISRIIKQSNFHLVHKIFFGIVCILIMTNNIYPGNFRWGQSKCQITYINNHACNDYNCEIYTYKMIHGKLERYIDHKCYNHIDCQLPLEIDCDIIRLNIKHPVIMPLYNYTFSEANITNYNILLIITLIIYILNSNNY